MGSLKIGNWYRKCWNLSILQLQGKTADGRESNQHQFRFVRISLDAVSFQIEENLRGSQRGGGLSFDRVVKSFKRGGTSDDRDVFIFNWRAFLGS